MENSNQQQYSKVQSLLNLLLFAVSALFFYNFCKMTIAYIVSMFQETFVVFPIMITYLLPMVYFIYHFKNCFLSPNKKISNIIFISITSILLIFCIVGYIINFPIYMSNNSQGVYEALPSFGISFPYDGIFIIVFLILINIYMVYFLIKPNSEYSYIRDSFKNYGFFKFSVTNLVLVVILTLFSSFYLGDFLNSFNSIENASFDSKYVFLMLLLLMPLANLVMFLIRPRIRKISKKSKYILFSSMIIINTIFLVTFLILELTNPGFVIHIGKPLFPLDFAISIPIGPYSLVVILVASIIFETISLIRIKSTPELL